MTRQNKHDNEFKLILLLTDGFGYTAEQLAEQLAVERRTIYNYFATLRQCGFHVVKNGAQYSLDGNSHFFQRITESMSLTDEEAAYIVAQLKKDKTHTTMSQVVRRKLARAFHLPVDTRTSVAPSVAPILKTIGDAIEQKRTVLLRDYASPHSATVKNRVVEPFLIMDDGVSVRCYEVAARMNKTFKVTRMGAVQMLDVTWAYEAEHKDVYTDVFRFSGDEHRPIVLRLGRLSKTLLTEEYPDAAACIASDGKGGWLFTADVVSFVAVGRFVLGLSHDIEVMGGEAFLAYLREQVASMEGRFDGR